MKTIILSIKPRYAEAILKKQKTVEFRRVIPEQPFDRVVIYASAPVQKFVGEFTAFRVNKCRIIADRHASQEFYIERLYNCCPLPGIPLSDLIKYFKGSTFAYSILISTLSEVIVYNPPIDPKLINPGWKPPQNFCYWESYQKGIDFETPEVRRILKEGYEGYKAFKGYIDLSEKKEIKP